MKQRDSFVDSPTVSVVVPTYNRLDYLRETVASVLGQTFADFELIVVDDGSVDGTADQLATLSDPRVRCLRLEHTGNIARVRNAGAARAAGRYLCFLDSDDLWRTDKLEIQTERTIHAGVRWSYTGFELVDATGRALPETTPRWFSPSGNIAESVIATRAPVALCTVLLERSLFRELEGFDEDAELILREDFELLARLAVAAPTVAIPTVLAQIRHHPGRTTHASAGAAPFVVTVRAYTRLLDRLTEPKLRRTARRRRAHHLRQAALRTLRAGRIGAAAAYAVRAIRDTVASVGRP